MITLVCVSCGQSRHFNDGATYKHQPLADWWVFERASLCSTCTDQKTKKMHRSTDPATSKAGAKDVLVRSGSQRYKLLTAYSGTVDCTADEAMRLSGVSDRSCYWKRVSELREGGFIEDTGSERLAESGSMQTVSRITSKCVQALQLSISN